MDCLGSGEHAGAVPAAVRLSLILRCGAALLLLRGRLFVARGAAVAAGALAVGRAATRRRLCLALLARAGAIVRRGLERLSSDGLRHRAVRVGVARRKLDREPAVAPLVEAERKLAELGVLDRQRFHRRSEYLAGGGQPVDDSG